MTLLYFAPVPWDSYPQRSHYVVRHFLKQDGHAVVWVDPYPNRLPRVRDLRDIRSRSRLVLDRPPTLRVVSPWALPVEPLAAGRWLNRKVAWQALARRLRPMLNGCMVGIGIGRPGGFALTALGELRPAWSFYDAMDDFPEFYSGIAKRSVQENEARIVRAVDVVATASSALWRKFEPVGPRRRMLFNAFEMASLPAPCQGRHRQRVFGYVGCVGAWFDWALVLRLADAMPDAAVHIVGPCFARPPRRLPSNVRLFPACAADRAIEHLQGFSVGLIPFRRTPLTEAVDPIKYYGYRGMGLPVLSSTFGEMTHRGIVERTFMMDQGAILANTAAATLGAVGDASTADVLAFRREHTWDHRLDESRLFQHSAS
jgi:hypothetical protein